MSSRPTILIIDDDETLTLVMKRVLRDYSVSVARSTEEGLLRVAESPFDAILCDLTLPDESGAAFYQKVAALRPTQELRVRFITGGATDAETLAAIDAAPERVLHKPFENDALRAFVASILE
jgi:CheY-like chemotaxis protein